MTEIRMLENKNYIIVYDETMSNQGWFNAKLGGESSDLATIKKWKKYMEESGKYKSVHILKKVL